MKLTIGKALAGLSLGVLLTFSPSLSHQAIAASFGAVRSIGDVSPLPLVDVQARVGTRRPVRPVRRAKRGNGGLAAGALIGAAILGGAIIANSQRRERPQQQYYYTPDGYLVDAYGNVVQQPRRGYRPQPVYRQQYAQPVYQAPRPRYRNQPVETNPSYQPPRVRYNQPSAGATPYACDANTGRCNNQFGQRLPGRYRVPQEDNNR